MAISMDRDFKNSELYESVYGTKERRSSYRFWVVLLVVAALLLGGRYYWTTRFGGVVVDGHSMDYTLNDKDYLVVQYAEYRQPKRGEIIVVHVEDYPEIQALNQGRTEEKKLKYLIKRLIATEGDTLYCEAGQIYIRYAGETQFTKLDEPYANYDNAAKGGKAGYSFATYTVGEGEVFFLGDNRHNSTDSRYKEEDGSHLQGRLYAEKDIFGVVPTWAVKHQKILETIFF